MSAGAGYVFTACSLGGSGSIPSLDTMYPRWCTSLCMKEHLLSFSFKLASNKLWKMLYNRSRCSSNELPKMMSSRYTEHCSGVNPAKMHYMSHWKVTQEFVRSKGKSLSSQQPPGVENAVFSLESSLSYPCQYPDTRSSVMK